jgi:hypothetical protein
MYYVYFLKPQRYHEFEKELKEKIEKDFIRDKVKLHFYKLNVYGKGGFFKPHVDTPVHPSLMVGTLVVCLPTPHQVFYFI